MLDVAAGLPYLKVWVVGEVGSGVSAVGEALGDRLAGTGALPPTEGAYDCVLALRTRRPDGRLLAHLNAAVPDGNWEQNLRRLPTGGGYQIVLG